MIYVIIRTKELRKVSDFPVTTSNEEQKQLRINKATFDLDFNQPTEVYIEHIVSMLNMGPKLIMRALSNGKSYNKEDLSLQSQIRRGELNFSVTPLEALGFIHLEQSGKSVLHSLTPLGFKVYEKYRHIFDSAAPNLGE